jgi:ribosomal protein L14E/L6E/L27E
MVDLTEISAVVAAAGVLVGVVYYILDMRHQSKVRQTDLVMRLYSIFDSLEFQKTWEEVLKREAKDLNDYEKKYSQAEVRTVGLFFEGIGILLERKLIDIELVDDMFTMPIKTTWEKLRDITLETRKVRNEPTDLEWFEYLYNEMKKREQKLQQLKV